MLSEAQPATSRTGRYSKIDTMQLSGRSLKRVLRRKIIVIRIILPIIQKPLVTWVQLESLTLYFRHRLYRHRLYIHHQFYIV